VRTVLWEVSVLPAKAPSNPPKMDTDADRYPALEGVLRAVLASPEIPSGPIERVEVNCLASGEATWRVWTPKADEPEGGYFAPGDLS
jgi:hypothetical protein